MTAAPAPLEAFLRDFVEAVGGVWDEVEPQVYDLIVPPAGGVLRVTFDPEALPEHPGSQLASFGTPLIDGLLADAVRRGRFGQFYLLGLNLAPHDLAGRVRRGLTLTPPLELHQDGARALHFAQAIYFFQAAFVSDQKEQALVPAALDLHHGRYVRHVEKLLDPARLAGQPALPYPEARRLSLAAAYPLARAEAGRTLGPMINVRQRELQERLAVQAARMRRYYADLREELEGSVARSRTDAETTAAKAADRRTAIDREEHLRLTELQQKNTLRTELRLLTLVVVQQPKVLVKGTLGIPERPAHAVELVWDPLLETLEAPACPVCKRPTFAFTATRLGQPLCPVCLGQGRAK